MTTDRLTLPGDIPRLLRRGSPVVWAAPIRPNPTLPAHLQAGPGRERRGLWMPLGPKADEGMVCWDTWCGANRVEEHVYAGNLALDLSDPTGRFHVLHWLASRDVAAVNDIADDMTGPIVGALYWAWLGWEDDTGAPLGWELNLWTARHFFLDNDLFEDLNHREVGVLADGSRRVDAEALRRIVLHVAGREVTP